MSGSKCLLQALNQWFSTINLDDCLNCNVVAA